MNRFEAMDYFRNQKALFSKNTNKHRNIDTGVIFYKRMAYYISDNVVCCAKLDDNIIVNQCLFCDICNNTAVNIEYIESITRDSLLAMETFCYSPERSSLFDIFRQGESVDKLVSHFYKLSRRFDDNNVSVRKDKILTLISDNYNSEAKMKKIYCELKVDLNTGELNMNYFPIKKSVSVKPFNENLSIISTGIYKPRTSKTVSRAISAFHLFHILNAFKDEKLIRISFSNFGSSGYVKVSPCNNKNIVWMIFSDAIFD